MIYKLLATDMDGTLLSDDFVITPGTVAALRRAVDSGVLFVPSTGRPMCGMDCVKSLFPEDLPYIIFNGAMAVTCRSGRVIYAQNLSAQHAREIYIQGYTQRGLPVTAWVGERLFISHECEETLDYQGITGAQPEIITDMAALSKLGVTKMIWIVDPAQAMGHQQAMQAHFGAGVNCHTSRPYLLEFVDSRASKARALEAVGAVYGVRREEMIAVGDSYNDLSMLEFAGLGVAMDNAPEEIKARCGYITLSNNDDGVAALIDNFWPKGANI